MTEETITRSARFYRLHRDEQLAKKKQEYDANPEVIARRAKRERLKAEREQEKIATQTAEKLLHLLPIKTPTSQRFIRRNAFRLWAF